MGSSLQANFLLLLCALWDFSTQTYRSSHCLLLRTFISIHFLVDLWHKLCCIYALFSWYFTLSIFFPNSGLNLFFLHFLLYCIFPYYFYIVYNKKIRKNVPLIKFREKSIHKENILVIWRKDDCLLSTVYSTLYKVLYMCPYFLFCATFYVLYFFFFLCLFSFFYYLVQFWQTVDDVIRIVVAKKNVVLFARSNRT